MSAKSIKYTCIFTLTILIIYAVMPLVPLSPWLSRRAEASSGNDALTKGILLALLLFLVSKVGQSSQDQAVDRTQPAPPPDRPDLGTSDVDLLARVIFAEARGEEYNGQVAVGAVVLNRLASPEFPNTIRGIIYQSGQFSSVMDGQINYSPNNTAYRAARDALSGIDPSHGALYFYNPTKAKNRNFFLNKQVTATIGHHVFLK